jgi:hypothetical protein
MRTSSPDVALNIATSQGFAPTVNVYGAASVDTFWSCNAPMSPFLLFGKWVKVFGFTFPAVRSLNYILMMTSMGVVHLGAKVGLSAMARSRSMPYSLVRRTQTVLLSGEGESNRELAILVSPATVL